MIKQAELQNSYMLGRQAAMEKLAQLPTVEGIVGRSRNMPYEQDILEQLPPDPAMSMPEAESTFFGLLSPENRELLSSLGSRASEAIAASARAKAIDDILAYPTAEIGTIKAMNDNAARQDMIMDGANDMAWAAEAIAGNRVRENRAKLQREIAEEAQFARNNPEYYMSTPDEMSMPLQSGPNMSMGAGGDQLSELQKQLAVARMIGLDPSMGSMAQNLSRAGILGGAVGGTALNPSLMGAGASLAGALGGGQVGGNIGRGINAALQSAGYGNMADKLIAAGGGLGGLAGGLGAGYATR